MHVNYFHSPVRNFPTPKSDFNDTREILPKRGGQRPSGINTSFEEAPRQDEPNTPQTPATSVTQTPKVSIRDRYAVCNYNLVNTVIHIVFSTLNDIFRIKERQKSVKANLGNNEQETDSNNVKNSTETFSSAAEKRKELQKKLQGFYYKINVLQ